jgi:predicted transcriptional regulator of viral defense system
MGKQIYLDRINELFEKSPVVSFSSINRIIKKKDYAKLFVSNLIKKKKIYKIGKGVYTKYDEVSLSVFAFSPAYIGLQSALSFYGIWEQETIPVILTTKKVRRGIRQFMGSNVLVRNIDKKYFFGFELQKDESFYLPYSDLEKTFIDMIVFNQPLDSEVLKKIKEKIDKKKFEKYVKRYSKKMQDKIRKK